MPRKTAQQYFKVEITRHSHLKLFSLSVHRLLKKKEAKANGFAPRNQYRLACQISNMAERDAKCISLALENPREPLAEGFEDSYWEKKLAGK